MRHSVRAQVFLAFFLISIVPLVGAGIFSIYKAKSILTEQAFATLNSIATIQKSRVEEAFQGYEHSIHLIASRTELRRRIQLLSDDFSPNHIQMVRTILLHAKNASPLIRRVDIVDLAGTIVASTDRELHGVSVKGKDYYNQGKMRTTFGGFINTDQNYLLFSSPMRYGERLIGVTVVNFDADKVYNISSDYTGLGTSGETLFAIRNEKNTPTIFGPLRFTGPADAQVSGNPTLPIVLATMEEYQGNFSESALDYRGEQVVAVSRYLKEYKLGVVVKRDKEEIFRPISELQNGYVIVGVALVPAILLLSILITRPIVRLAKIAKNFATGTYDTEAVVSGADEVSAVARALNLAIATNKSSVETLREKVEDAKKELQESYRESAQLAAIVDSTSDAVISKGFDGKIVTWNQGAERMFGYKAEEVVGKPINILLLKEDKETEEQQLKIQKGDTIPTFETKRVKKDGSYIDVSLTLSLMCNKANEAIGISYICRDITFKKKIENELTSNMKQLETKNAEMEQLVYTISHDLKSPIVTASSFLQFLREDICAGAKERIEDSLSRLESAIKKMELLTSQILTVSRAGGRKLEAEVIDLNKVIAGCLEDVQEDLKAKNPNIIVAKKFPSIVADRSRIIQVFENLVLNAYKYGCSANNGNIEIGFDTSCSEGLKIFVRDTGPGIEKQYHSKIFGLFQRLETEQNGTGVGLSIVERTMKAHGGSAWVESEIGKGSTFWLMFPNAQKGVS